VRYLLFEFRNNELITGFNTDVEHEGVVYHVQTEDKGLDTPFILSLVYAGGAILASKRSPYNDLIASGFDETTLADRVKRQHRLICAAIVAGRLEELKTLGSREAKGDPPTSTAVTEEQQIEKTPIEVAPSEVAQAVQADEAAVTADVRNSSNVPAEERQEDLAAYSVHDSRRQSALEEFENGNEGLRVQLLDEQDLLGGQSLTLRIMVSNYSRGKEKPKSGAPVSVKVLGTTFRPVIYSAKTQRDGIATVAAEIPQFTSGRAAVLVRAQVGGETVEVRRVIHPG
jgi:hypothetical protein